LDRGGGQSHFRRTKIGTAPEADGEGFELPQKTPENQGFPDESGAESGALDAKNEPEDPELGTIIDAWPTLPDALRTGILAMIRATIGKK
jgi:hypothetical protein